MLSLLTEASSPFTTSQRWLVLAVSSHSFGFNHGKCVLCAEHDRQAHFRLEFSFGQVSCNN